MHIFWKAAALSVAAAVGVAWVAVSTDRGERDMSARVTFLASTAHVVVGDVPLRAPYIAVPGYTGLRQHFSPDGDGEWQRAQDHLTALRAVSDAPDTAPTVDMIEIRVRAFGRDDVHPPFRTICEQFSLQWATAVCDDPRFPLIKALPVNRFYLADDHKIAVFDRHVTVGMERVGDQLRRMDIRGTAPSVECDRETSESGTLFCTAALRVQGHLIAVWPVWTSDAETPVDMAAREGAAIQAFVRHGLGPTEDLDALIAAACRLQAPSAPTQRYLNALDNTDAEPVWEGPSIPKQCR